MVEAAERTESWLEPVPLALRLTLAALLLRPIGDAVLGPAFLGLAAAGLVMPRALRIPALWLALAVLAAVRVIDDWPLPDNHAYLLAYWCLAIAVALRSAESERALVWSARILVGLVFTFASLWKLALSPDFLSAEFMRFTWIVDERFEAAARVFGGMDVAMLEANRVFLEGAPGAPAGLEEPAAFTRATRLATWFTAAIEPAVAVAFLWRGERGPTRWRDGLLLAFCATT